MKTLTPSLIKILRPIIFLVLVLVPSCSLAQQIIVTEQGDTLVTLTPEQVKTVNIVFSDHKLLTEKSQLQHERIELLSHRVELADSVIVKYGILTEELKHDMALRELAYRNTQRKERVKYFVIGGVTGVAIGALVTFLICR